MPESAATQSKARTLVLLALSLLAAALPVAEPTTASYHALDEVQLVGAPPNNTLAWQRELKETLDRFYYSLGGPYWKESRFWTDPFADYCDYYGIDCETNATTQWQTISVSLSHNNLTGTLEESVFASPVLAAHLEILNLATNNIYGPLPPSITKYSNLTSLILVGNAINGSIPDNIDAMSALNDIQLGSNLLSSTIPESLYALPRMVYIYLDNNALTGSISPHIGNLTHLQALDLSSNKLTGTLPVELGIATLRYLAVAQNQLSGAIPLMLTMRLPSLTKLVLSMNQFGGTLTNFYALSSCSTLMADHNNFTGTITTQLRFLRLGAVIDISHNNLTGALPMSVFPVMIEEGFLAAFNAEHNPLLRSDAPELPDFFVPDAEIVDDGRTFYCSNFRYNGKVSFHFSVDASYYDFEYCTCAKGFYGVAPLRCFECPEPGAHCSGDNSVQLPLNYFPIVPAAFNTNSSIPPIYLEPCFGDSCSVPVSVTLGQDGEVRMNGSVCEPGTAGRICSQCLCPFEGDTCFYSHSTHCSQCSVVWMNDQGIVALLVVAAAAFVLMTAVFTRSAIKELRKQIDAKFKLEDEGANKPGMSAKRIWSLKSSGPVKIGLIYLQTLSQLLTTTSSDQVYTRLMNVVKLVTSGQTRSIGLACLIPGLSGPFAYFISYMMLPFGIAALLLLALLTAKVLTSIGARSCIKESQRKLDRYEAEDDPVNYSSDGSTAPVSSSGLRDVDEQEQLIASQVDQDELIEARGKAQAWTFGQSAVSNLLTISYFFYFGVSLQILAVWNCKSQQWTNDTYMESMPWLSCASDSWILLNRAAIGFLVVYTIGNPVVYTILLVVYRKFHNVPRTYNMIGLLYRTYRPDATFYELVIIARRVLLAVALAVIPTETAFQSWSVAVVLGAALLTQVWIQPFHVPIHNKLEELTLVVLMLTHGAQVSMLASPVDLTALSVTIIALNVATLVSVVVVVVREAIWPS